MVVYGWLRLVFAVALLGMGVLAVQRIPHGALWKPAVAATEWGHVFAVAALLAVVGPWSDGLGRLSGGLGLLACGLLLTPALRAHAVARTLPDRFATAFGPAVALPAGRPAPLVPGDLFRSISAGPRPVTHTFPGADGTPLRLDLYRPASTGRAPLVVTVHGGSWNSGDRTVLPDLNAYLAARGYAVAAVEYRFAPAHPFPAMRDDVLAAIAWLRERADANGIDPDRIVLHGRSAGGHLALSAAYHARDPAIRGVIALYPPTDMYWSWANPGSAWIIDTPGTLRDLLGGPPGDGTRPVYDAASPIRFVEAGVPTLLVHGGRDELVFPEQSRRLAEALAGADVPHLAVELPWGTHGVDANLSGPGGQLTTWLVERFLATVAPP